MCARGQAENQQAGGGIAERWNRFTPVIPIKKSAAFRNRDFPAVGYQPGASLARYNFVVQRDKVLFITFCGTVLNRWNHLLGMSPEKSTIKAYIIWLEGEEIN
jgi:hypothetical protein